LITFTPGISGLPILPVKKQAVSNVMRQPVFREGKAIIF